MSVIRVLVILLTVFALSCGQVLFKMAADGMNLEKDSLLASVLRPTLIGGLLICAAALAVWIGLLRETPLRIAYPFFALAFVIVPVLSWLWLGEPLRAASLIGGAIIVAGVWISVAYG